MIWPIAPKAKTPPVIRPASPAGASRATSANKTPCHERTERLTLQFTSKQAVLLQSASKAPIKLVEHAITNANNPINNLGLTNVLPIQPQSIRPGMARTVAMPTIFPASSRL